MSISVNVLIALDVEFHWERYVPEYLEDASLTVKTR